MPSYNRVILCGNVTRDIELKYTPSGTAVAEVGLAVNHKYTTQAGEKREEVTFVDVSLWGRTAEIAGEYLKKGHPVLIEGRLKLETWDDKQSGQKRSKLKVIGESMQLIGGGTGRQPKDEEDPRPAKEYAGRSTSTQSKPKDPDLDVPEDEKIPF